MLFLRVCVYVKSGRVFLYFWHRIWLFKHVVEMALHKRGMERSHKQRLCSFPHRVYRIPHTLLSRWAMSRSRGKQKKWPGGILESSHPHTTTAVGSWSLYVCCTCIIPSHRRVFFLLLSRLSQDHVLAELLSFNNVLLTGHQVCE